LKEDERAVVPLFVGAYELNTYDVLGSFPTATETWFVMANGDLGVWMATEMLE